MSDAERIARKVQDVRRRLVLVRLVNTLAVAACGFALAATFFGVRGGQSGLPVAASAGVLLVAAAAAALLSAPSGRDVARLVDSRLGLQQRLETAWECRSLSGEIDLLLLRDAGQRLRYVRAGAVAPFELYRATKIALTAGLVLIPSLGIVRVLDSSRGWGLFPSGTVAGVATAGAGAGAGEAVTGAADAGRLRTATAAQARAAGAARGAPSAAGEPGRAPRVTPEVQALFPSREPSPAGAEADKGAAPDLAGAGPRTSVDASPRPASPSDSGRADRTSDAAGAGAPTEAGRPGTGEQPAANTAGSTTGAASVKNALGPRPGAPAAGRPAGPGEGGTAGALPTELKPAAAPRPTTGLDAAFLFRYAREYQALGRTAEAALARENIPPGLRKYIADYFAAIHR